MSEEYSTQIINLKFGEQFDIILKANPQNGYLWTLQGFEHEEVEENSYLRNINNVVRFDSEVKEPLPSYMGCKQHFKFSSLNRGQVELKFVYKRSWESEPYDVKQFSVVVQ